MVLIKLAAYILAITVILTVATRVMWLLLGLFAFRSWNALLPYELLSSWVPSLSEGVYLAVMIALAVGTYFLVVGLTRDFMWVRYVVLVFMTIWVFRHFTFQDIFFFKDWLEMMGLWGWDKWFGQIKELFTSDSEQIGGQFGHFFEIVFGWILSVWEFVRNL